MYEATRVSDGHKVCFFSLFLQCMGYGSGGAAHFITKAQNLLQENKMYHSDVIEMFCISV